MIRPQSITTYPCSIIITLWQLLGVGSALAKLTCNPVDFLLLFQLSWNIFTTCLHATKLKKKLPRSFKMGSKMCAPPILHTFTRKKFLALGVDSLQNRRRFKYVLHEVYTTLAFRLHLALALGNEPHMPKDPFYPTRHLGPSLPTAFTTKFHSFGTFIRVKFCIFRCLIIYSL